MQLTNKYYEKLTWNVIQKVQEVYTNHLSGQVTNFKFIIMWFIFS